MLLSEITVNTPYDVDREESVRSGYNNTESIYQNKFSSVVYIRTHHVGAIKRIYMRECFW